MNNIDELVRGLSDTNNKYAYKCLTELENESFQTNIVYPYFEVFAEMLNSENSYIRTRGLTLIAANARWDKDYKVDEIIDKYLRHIIDDKPITSRECIKALPRIAEFKPELKDDIVYALKNANFQSYRSSMQSLICNDINKAIEAIEKTYG